MTFIALPKSSLFTSLHELLASYPTTPALRSLLLDHLHSLLQQTLPTDPVAMKLTATRNLGPNLSPEVFVDTLKDANERMTSAVQQACGHEDDGDGMAQSYVDFVTEWMQRDELDDSLVSMIVLSEVFASLTGFRTSRERIS